MSRLALLAVCLSAAASLPPASALAENLFHDSQWANVASDQKARRVGDLLTVVVYQNTEARNGAENVGRRRHGVDGSLRGGSVNESAALSLDSHYSGEGEVRRSASFVTQISVVVAEVLANGDLGVAGEQRMSVNGEETLVRVRGRVRPADITSGNQVLSTRIADAQISYDGHGFVSRNARPGLIHALFNLLGLAG